MTVTDRVRARAERIGWMAHVVRAVRRYNFRFGYQLGAGVSYFSVLAVVPVLMVTFSVLGFFLVEVRPDLIVQVSELVTAQLRAVDSDTLASVQQFVVDTLQDYSSIGLVGLVAGLYSGAAWMGHLRNAIDALWRTDFDAERDPTPYPVKVVLNSGRMAGLLVSIAVTFGLATISTNLAQQVATWLGFGDSWFTSVALRVVAPLLSLVAGWATFCYIYLVVPRQRESWRLIRVGALLGTVGLFLLQYATALIISAFSGNPAAAVFGPVIVVMLFFNLFAQLILIIAAWIATSEEAAVPVVDEGVVRFPLVRSEPAQPGEPVVTQANAARVVRLGLGAGWLTGAATGLGLGAIFAWVVQRFGSRHSADKISGRRPYR